MNDFWKNWLQIWCWAVALFGVVLALGAMPAVSGPARLIYGVLGADPTNGALLDMPQMQFAFTLLAAIRLAEPGGAGFWRMLTMAVMAWYVIDCVISAMTGFALNVVSNTILTAGFLAPVLCSGVLRKGANA